MAANVQNNGEDVQYGENVTVRDIIDDDGNPYHFLAWKWRRLYGDVGEIYECDEDNKTLRIEIYQWVHREFKNEIRKIREELENH